MSGGRGRGRGRNATGPGTVHRQPAVEHILDLPDEFQADILHRAAPDARHRQRLALVCRHWRTMLALPITALWRTVSFRAQSGSADLLLTFSAMQQLLSWVHRNTAAIRFMQIGTCLTSQGGQERGSVLGMLLAKLSLDGAKLDAAGISDWRPWLAALSAMPQQGPQRLLRLLTLSGLPPDLKFAVLSSMIKSLPHLQEVSLNFEDRAADATGGQMLLSSFTYCYFLRALRITAARRLEVGQLPAALSTLQRLSALELTNAGMAGSRCIPAHLPAMRMLSVCDSPPWPPQGNVLFPASLSALQSLNAFQSTCLGYDGHLAVSLQHLHLDCAYWRGPSTGKVVAFVSVSSLTALRSLRASNASITMVANLHELLLAANQLPGLKHLGLPNCSLTQLASWPLLQRLTSLDLCGNRFPALPEALKTATACQLLDLSRIPFNGPAGCLPVKDIAFFLQLPALRCLGLRTELPPNTPPQDAALRQEVLSALQAVLLRHSGRVITEVTAAFPALDAAALLEYTFQLDACFD